MASMNISLPEELKDYVEERTRGAYSTPSEYVRDLIRQDRRQHAQERLDTLLAEGLASGKPVPAGSKFWSELRGEATARLSGRRRARK